MRNYHLLVPLFASLASAAGCTQTECATGTIERDGKCEPADVQTSAGQCGPGTELQGDICVPVVTPTHCDPATTEEQTNPDGTITCIGTGGSSCDTPIACPTPSGTKMTICGQLYDFENNAKFSDTTGSGNCDPANPATSGPCALQIQAYDAIAFATNPSTAAPLTVDSVTIDKCGRYRVAGIDTGPAGPFIGLGIDDAGMPLGPAGVTVTVGVAAPKAEGPVLQGFEGWIVKASTTQLWTTSGGTGAPTLSGGIYAAVFRKHKKGVGDPFENQSGVTIQKSGTDATSQDWYFQPTELTHQNLLATATATGANGTALVTGAMISDGAAAYSAQTGLGPGCRWEAHAAASLPGIVFIQVYRKLDIIGQTCND